MAYLTKSLVMPNGEEIEFVGKTWYGECSTAGTAQTKIVDIPGFTSENLIAGTRVIVRFIQGQLYNGIPQLNVSGTGPKIIYRNGGSPFAGQYEWGPYDLIAFVCATNDNTQVWFIENSYRANTTYYGKTKLSNTISNDETVALTPAAVYNAGYLTLADLPIYDGSVT